METIHNFRKNKGGYFMSFVQNVKRGKGGRFEKQDKYIAEHVIIGLLFFICLALTYKLIQLY